MSGKLVGEHAMSSAERQRRYRARAKALRDAATPSAAGDVVAVTAKTNGSEPTCFAAEEVPALGTNAITALPAERPHYTGSDDYPRMLYHPDGRTIVVESPEEHDKAMADGWGTIRGCGSGPTRQSAD
jgi:hypothetical protein